MHDRHDDLALANLLGRLRVDDQQVARTHA
jgi:hypothetical protein